MLNSIHSSPSVNHHQNGQISGRGLAHRKLGYAERLELAADVAERVRRYHQTDAQIAANFGVSPSQLCRELKARAEWRVIRGVEINHDNYAVACIQEGIDHASPYALDKALLEVLPKVWDSIDRLTHSH